MKKLLILSLLIAASFAQSLPPVTAIKLTPQTFLSWNPNPASENVTAYLVELKQGTNLWSKVVSTNKVTLSSVHPQVAPGAYTFSVAAANNTGLGPSASISTNLGIAPSIIVNLRVEVVFEN
jgi:hypothetical protein